MRPQSGSQYSSNRRILSITPGNQPLSLFFLLDIVLKAVTNKKLLRDVTGTHHQRSVSLC